MDEMKVRETECEGYFVAVKDEVDVPVQSETFPPLITLVAGMHLVLPPVNSPHGHPLA